MTDDLNMHYEVKSVHPRVAAYLESNGWLYLHEYQSSGWGIVDFLAINKRNGIYCLIECKREIADTNAVISQLKRYSRISPKAQLLAISMHPASLNQIAKLNRDGIAYMHIPEETPLVRPLPPSKAYHAFDQCMKKFHGYSVYPSHHIPYVFKFNETIIEQEQSS